MGLKLQIPSSSSSENKRWSVEREACEQSAVETGYRSVGVSASTEHRSMESKPPFIRRGARSAWRLQRSPNLRIPKAIDGHHRSRRTSQASRKPSPRKFKA